MLRMMGVLASLYRRWKYVEEDPVPTSVAELPPDPSRGPGVLTE